MTDTRDLCLLAARVMLAALFVTSALDKFRLEPAELQQIASLHLPAPAFFAVLVGIFEMVGAASLVLGAYARISAMALALFIAFVTLCFLQFWSFEGPAEMRAMLKNVFFGNIALTGGLLYLAVCGPGRFAFVDL
ncbi:DoxX family protein [Xylophilus sp. GW821-FHT01B05]